MLAMNPIPKMTRIRITSPILAGIVNAFVWLCVGAVLISLLMNMTNVKEEKLTVFAFALHAIACAAGGFSSGKRADSKGWYYGALLGLVYTTIVALVGFLGFDAGVGLETLALLGISLGLGMIGGMVGVNARR